MELQKRMLKGYQIVTNRLKTIKLDENILCKEFWKKLIAITERLEKEELLPIVYAWEFMTQNGQWVFAQNIIQKGDLIDWFTKEEREAHNIFIEQKVSIKDQVAFLFDCTGDVLGHSKVSCFGATSIEAFDTSVVYAYDFSQVKATECFVFAFGHSRVTMLGYGKVEAFENSTGSVKGKSILIINDEAVYSSTPSVLRFDSVR